MKLLIASSLVLYVVVITVSPVFAQPSGFPNQPPTQPLIPTPQPMVEIPSHEPDEETRDPDEDPSTVGRGWIITGDIFLGVGIVLAGLTLDSFSEYEGWPREQVYKRRAYLILSTSLGLATLGGVMRVVGKDKRHTAYLEEGYRSQKGNLETSWNLARLGGPIAGLGIFMGIIGITKESKSFGVGGSVVAALGLILVGIEPFVGPRDYHPRQVSSHSRIQYSPYIAPDMSGAFGVATGWSAGLVGTY